MWVILSFELIVADLGQEKGLVIANITGNNILTQLAIGSVVMFALNYLISRKLMNCKKTLLVCLTIAILSILIFIPFYHSSKQSFIEYQNETIPLQKSIDNEKNYPN